MEECLAEAPSAEPSRSAKCASDSTCAEQMWASIDHAALRSLILEQIPRFRLRPYLADASAVDVFIAAGLDASLDGDYCWSLCFAPAFVRTLCSEGFLPICSELGGGTNLFVLLPKLHERRCVLHFDALHVPRRVCRRALRAGYTLSVDDAYEDSRFHRAVDEETNFKTRSVMCVPVLDDAGDVVAVVQMINAERGVFDANDEKLGRMLAKHVAIFMAEIE